MRDVEMSEMGDKKRKRIPGLKPHVEKVKEIRTESLGPGNRSKKNMILKCPCINGHNGIGGKTKCGTKHS